MVAGELFELRDQRDQHVFRGAAAHHDDFGGVCNRRQLQKGNGKREQGTFHERFIVPSTVKRSCRNKAIARFARGVMSRMKGKPAPEGSMFRVGNLL
jgi:hypothetical protein